MKIWISSLLIIASLFSANCKKEAKDDNVLLAGLLLYLSNQIKVNSATDLVNESAENYNDNNWGLITGQTLNRFVSDWTANKPSHISGNLIILQTDVANKANGGGEAWNPYVKSDASKGVYVYTLNDYKPASLPSGGFRFNQTRDSGLFSNSIRYQANGEFVDDWLNTYGINPTKDLIVFAVGTGNSANNSETAITGAAPAPGTAAGGVQDITRGVYWLRYWGVDIKHLAILNGNLRSNFAKVYPAQTSSTKSTLPAKGNFTVKSIRVDNTIITSGLEDIYEIAKNNLEAQIPGLTTKQFLIDARPTSQFTRAATGAGGVAGTYITTAYDSAGAPVLWGAAGDANSANNGGKAYIPFEGSIKGAVTFPWLALFEGFTDAGAVSTSDADAFAIGYRYKSKSALKAIFANKGYTAGATVVSQCRTNFEAQVNGFAALNILGYPSTYYDGSLVEWTALTAGHDTSPSLNKVPTDFKWRTDLPSVSSNIGYNTRITQNSAASTNPASTPTVRVISPDPVLTATTTKLFIQQDKAYK